MKKIAPPQSEAELLDRVTRLAGLSWAALASTYQQKIPTSLLKAKGFMGQFMEDILGATAQNLSEPDFQDLGIELKTLPLNAKGEPRESTYVCTAPISLSAGREDWLHSRVRKKIARVLWVPFEADPSIPLSERRIGNAFLWSPDPETEDLLRQDWEELTYMLQLGKTANLSAKIGVYLQVRPKAAHSRILNALINEEGEIISQNPRGFYLRSRFTQKILNAQFG